MRVFLLDDIRDEVAAYNGAGLTLKQLAKDQVTIARTFDDGVKIINDNEKFDLWILDHDLGSYAPDSTEQNGYDFLMYNIYSAADKIPEFLVSCSSNPPGRERILQLFSNWNKFNDIKD